MSPGMMQILIVLVVALLLFGGRGRISSIMGDMAKGIRSFRKGLSDEEEAKAKEEKKALDDDKTINVTPSKDKEKTGS